MKKVTIIICSLLVATALALGVTSTSLSATPQEVTQLCDLDHVRVSF